MTIYRNFYCSAIKPTLGNKLCLRLSQSIEKKNTTTSAHATTCTSAHWRAPLLGMWVAGNYFSFQVLYLENITARVQDEHSLPSRWGDQRRSPAEAGLGHESPSLRPSVHRGDVSFTFLFSIPGRVTDLLFEVNRRETKPHSTASKHPFSFLTQIKLWYQSAVLSSPPIEGGALSESRRRQTLSVYNSYWLKSFFYDAKTWGFHAKAVLCLAFLTFLQMFLLSRTRWVFNICQYLYCTELPWAIGSTLLHELFRNSQLILHIIKVVSHSTTLWNVCIWGHVFFPLPLLAV